MMSGLFSAYATAFAMLFKFLFIGLVVVAIAAGIIMLTRKIHYHYDSIRTREEAEDELRQKNEEKEEIRHIQQNAWENAARKLYDR